jgi:hypothetical protein
MFFSMGRIVAEAKDLPGIKDTIHRAAARDRASQQTA